MLGGKRGLVKKRALPLEALRLGHASVSSERLVQARLWALLTIF